MEFDCRLLVMNLSIQWHTDEPARSELSDANIKRSSANEKTGSATKVQIARNY